MKKVIVLLGPTGVGKTGASILLAQELATEIISADSMQVYRGMDIGTAKPPAVEQALVKHHMIDVVDPSERFSAGAYVSAVVPVIERLHSSGRTPLIVGGTGLYIKALTRGLFSGPGADLALRESLLAEEKESPGVLYERLRRVDAEAAERINRNDLRRVVRALEIWMKRAEGISSIQKRLTSPLPYDFIKIGLTRDRSELYRLIDERVELMVRQGLIREVERLVRTNHTETPLQAIGYKEIAGHLRGEISLDEAIRLVKRNSRRYAKRQLIWFRGEDDIRWIDVTGVFDSREIADRAKAALSIFPLPRRGGNFLNY